MAWKLLKVNGQPYLGINVGIGVISLSVGLNDLLEEKKWTNVSIRFDDERNLIKFTKVDTGYSINRKHSISSRIYKYMPLGRYEVEEETKDYVLFRKKLDPKS